MTTYNKNIFDSHSEIATVEGKLHTDKSFKVRLSNLVLQLEYTVELQWLEQLWNHENMFETGSSS